MVRSTTIKTDTAWCIEAAQANTRKNNSNNGSFTVFYDAKNCIP